MTEERRDAIKRVLWRSALVLCLAYIGASTASGYLMTGMLGKALAAFNTISGKKVGAASLNLSSTDNYHGIEKAIKDRNLFNSAGEFPEEKVEDGKEGQPKSAFDINGACGKPSVNVELLGTIYLGDSGSVATMQEKGYSESDIYREGDVIIGNDKVSVARIDRNRVILNNDGVKECLELKVEGPKQANESSFGSGPAVTAGPGDGAPPAAAGTDCALDEKYVQDELGPGFGTIIQKARLVPNTTDNQMNGFKIFAIDQSSLLGKTGLQNGDIITQVNDVSLKQPEQGFALYQAFQDEREVRIQILRRGTTPMMINCRIK